MRKTAAGGHGTGKEHVSHQWGSLAWVLPGCCQILLSIFGLSELRRSLLHLLTSLARLRHAKLPDNAGAAIHEAHEGHALDAVESQPAPPAAGGVGVRGVLCQSMTLHVLASSAAGVRLRPSRQGPSLPCKALSMLWPCLPREKWPLTRRSPPPSHPWARPAPRHWQRTTSGRGAGRSCRLS